MLDDLEMTHCKEFNSSLDNLKLVKFTAWRNSIAFVNPKGISV